MSDRGDFATLLRAWRDRLRPEAVGLPSGGAAGSGRPRRAAGVRREELASLAGISVDYVVRLEQGRAAAPSEQVVAALARALQLTEEERDQLYVAAGLAPRLQTVVPTFIPPSVQRLLARLPDVGIAVYAADWTQLTENDAWRAIHGGTGWQGRERNLVWRQFTGLGSRNLPDPEHDARFRAAIVADLRTASIRYPDDAALSAMIADLLRDGVGFRTLWDEVSVAVHRGEHKTILHPAIGPITLDCDTFTVTGTDLKIVTFTAEPGSEDETKLALAMALGETAGDARAGSSAAGSSSAGSAREASR